MNELQQRVWEALCELDGETVANLFTDYHGMQLIDKGFEEYLIRVGFVEESEEESEDE